MNLDKQILEELKKFKLMSNYSPKKTLSENIISEQNSNNDEILRYLKAGASGPLAIGLGTDIQSIIKAITAIKDVNQFREINNIMAKTPNLYNNYGSIIQLLRGELESDDEDELKKIIEILKTKGINVVYKTKTVSSKGTTGDETKEQRLDPESIEIQGPPTSGTMSNLTPRQNNINVTFCSVKNGIIVNPASKFNNVRWANWIKLYPLTKKEIDTAKASCPNAELSKTVWKAEPINLDDATNTLKKGMKGDKIKLLQQKLDIRGRNGQPLITGSFWDYTDNALKQKYPNEYTTEKGVTKTLFDKITGGGESTTEPDSTTTNIPATYSEYLKLKQSGKVQ